MIECKFVYKFNGGGTSDSLNRTHKVHAIPRVGDRVGFVGEDGSFVDSQVQEIIHVIDPQKDTHEVVVYYGDNK